jgi:hypothetical protein
MEPAPAFCTELTAGKYKYYERRVAAQVHRQNGRGSGDDTMQYWTMSDDDDFGDNDSDDSLDDFETDADDDLDDFEEGDDTESDDEEV